PRPRTSARIDQRRGQTPCSRAYTNQSRGQLPPRTSPGRASTRRRPRDIGLTRVLLLLRSWSLVPHRTPCARLGDLAWFARLAQLARFARLAWAMGALHGRIAWGLLGIVPGPRVIAR